MVPLTNGAFQEIDDSVPICSLRLFPYMSSNLTLTYFNLIQSFILQLSTHHKHHKPPPFSTPNRSTHLQACPKDADAFHQSWPQQTPRKAEKSRPVASAERPERRVERRLTRELGPVKAPGRGKAPMKCWPVDKLTPSEWGKKTHLRTQTYK